MTLKNEKTEMSRPRFSLFDRFVATVAILMTLALLALAIWPPSFPEASDSLRFFGRLHPVSVHLPIGFLFALLILEMLDLCIRSAILHHATYVMAWLAALAALFAVLAGVLLALPGGYSDELLFRHRWLGVLTAACAVWILAWKVCRSPRAPHGWSFVYHPLLVVTAAMLAGAGHYGGSLTHGSDYLTAYMPETMRSYLGLPERVTASVVDPHEAIIFADLIEPIFRTNCIRCHGTERQRGGLRLDSYAHLIEGGDSGPDVGLIAESLRLPLDDDRRMPPRDRPPLSEEDIALITWWVRNGAEQHARITEIQTTAQIDRILEARFGLLAAPATAPMKEWESIAALVDRLGTESGAGIRRVARDTPAVEIPFITPGSNFGDAELARLVPLAANVQNLNLSRTEVTDEGLAHVAEMTNLLRLDLSNTSVSDAGLSYLSDLQRLRYLNLYGTRITDDGLNHLRGLPNLRQVYVWQTSITPDGAERLRASLEDGFEIDSLRAEIRELERRIEAAGVVIDRGQTPPAEATGEVPFEADPASVSVDE